jgi:putative salt-induced outer membrane protein YdiY
MPPSFRMHKRKRIINTSVAFVAAATTSAFAQDADPTAWKTSAGVSVSVQKGNADTTLFGANILSSKKWDKNEINLGADGVYGDNTSVDLAPPDANGNVSTREVSRTTAQNYGAFAQYNRLISDRFYAYGNVSARQDRIADVDYRISLSPGAGYYFLKNEKTTLSVEAGPGFVFEKLAGTSKEFWTIRLGERLTHQITKSARLFQDAEFIPQVDDFNNYVIQGQIGVEADITKKLALRVVFQDTYRNEPAPITGTIPLQFREKNDLKLLAGINYKFQ